MATLILSAVGSAIGGPIGSAVGALIGQQIDAKIFAPKGRQGPRLGELAVQTSSYGTAMPKIFGTMRVAGTVIWATDLKETRTKGGGGKGRPKTTTYSYSASFAVALSARPIRGVKRIWADGKLLRGVGGDFKSDTRFRLYLGTESQAVDPLIASAEGAGQTPAFRGIAYAMFEDLQLEDFGNRIPSLTFEVEADAGPVTIATIAEELGGAAVVGGETPSVAGYAASGDSVRGAIEALGDVAPLSLRDDGNALVLTTAQGPPIEIAGADAGASTSAGVGGRSEVARRAAASVAQEVSVAYHDVARDYQTGLQRATRGGPSRRSERLALPATLDAGAAKAIAERRLAALWAGRATAKVHLGARKSGIRPGAHLRIEGQGGLWKVERWTHDRMVVSLELAGVKEGAAPATAGASPGRPVGHPDLLHGPTILRLFDLPLGDDSLAARPDLLAAAAGGEGWRRAALMVSLDGGASWEEAGPTAAPAVMGTVLTTLGPGGSALFDSRNSLDVELLNDAMWLEGRSEEALVGGANLAMVGDELIQFGAAEPLGGRRFRLSRLTRGRRGTDWAAAGHQAGEAFTLIERETLAVIELATASLGGEARLMASGLGDGSPATASRAITGEAMRPPSPVHLSVARHANGDLAFSWVRRSRNGWTWLSGSDTPLGEENEAYRVELSGTGFARSATVSEPAYVYSAAQQGADGSSGALTLSVMQIGTVATSRAATIGLQI